MTFTRTPLGLSNQHLFWRVDAIVFIEGGEDSLSYKQVLSGLYGSQSHDLLFWQGLFSFFITNKKYQFRPVGSKGTLIHIANDIKSGKVSHVYVAMDRDYDNIIGSLILAPGVLYTYGYSWENDVFNESVLIGLFRSMCPVSTSGIEYEKDIKSLVRYFSREMRWAVYADILLFYHGSSLIPRSKRPDYVLDRDSNGKPTINRRKISTLIKHAKSKRTSKIVFGKKITFSPCIDCYGHLMALYFYRVLMYLLKYYSNIPDLPKYYAYTNAISQFCMELPKSSLSLYHKYYEKQFSVLPY